MTENNKEIQEALDSLLGDINDLKENVSNSRFRFHIEKTRTGVTPRPFTVPPRVVTEIEIATPDEIWEITRTER